MPELTDLQFAALAVIGFLVLCACGLCLATLAAEPIEEEQP